MFELTEQNSSRKWLACSPFEPCTVFPPVVARLSDTRFRRRCTATWRQIECISAKAPLRCLHRHLLSFFLYSKINKPTVPEHVKQCCSLSGLRAVFPAVLIMLFSVFTNFLYSSLTSSSTVATFSSKIFSSAAVTAMFRGAMLNCLSNCSISAAETSSPLRRFRSSILLYFFWAFPRPPCAEIAQIKSAIHTNSFISQEYSKSFAKYWRGKSGFK